MYMEPIVHAKPRPAKPTNAVDLAMGILVLTGSALLLLPSVALYSVYIAAALVARTFWKKPRTER